MAKPFKKPPTEAQVKAYEAAKAKSAARSKATAQKKAELNRGATEMSQAERTVRLTPKLISGKVVMFDGRQARIAVDPLHEVVVAQFAEGEFWIVNKLLRPVERASEGQARRAGFDPPYRPEQSDLRRANALQRKVDRGELILVVEAK